MMKPANGSRPKSSRTKDTYLSVDLDYFDCVESVKPTAGWKRFLDKIFDLGVEISFWQYHTNIFRRINKLHNISTVINVDFHSDLASKDESDDEIPLNEGTWANFIKPEIKNFGEFIWYMPHKECYDRRLGRCDCLNKPNPFIEPFSAGWRKTRHLKGIPSDSVLSRVKEVGIVLSPNWLDEETGKKVVLYLYKQGMFSYNKYMYFMNFKDWGTQFEPSISLF